MIVQNKNIKIFLNWFLGPALFIWLSSSIYLQIKKQPNLDETLHNMQTLLYGEQWWKLWVIILLMLINWSIEAAKWKILMQPLEKISWWRSLKATLAGVAFAMNTPNRIGEYGGRILYVHEGNRLNSIALTVAGSMSQIIVTLVMGCGGIIYLLHFLPVAALHSPSQSYLFWMQITLYFVVAITLFFILLYLRIGWLLKLAEKIPGSLKYLHHLTVLEALSVRSLLRVLLLSFTRYAVFVFQYILMLQMMQVDVNFWQAVWLVSILFFVLATIPTIALAELGLRGTISLQLFGWYSTNAAGIIATSAGIWFINLVLPALAGSLLILGIKIFRK